MSVIYVNSILHGAHLLPRFPWDAPVFWGANYTNVLDLYMSFYVNKFINHHTSVNVAGSLFVVFCAYPTLF